MNNYIESIDRTLKELICKNSFNCANPNDIVEETDIVEDLGFDSLHFFSLLLDIEEKFNIEIMCFDISDMDYSSIRKLIVNKVTI